MKKLLIAVVVLVFLLIGCSESHSRHGRHGRHHIGHRPPMPQLRHKSSPGHRRGYR